MKYEPSSVRLTVFTALIAALVVLIAQDAVAFSCNAMGAIPTFDTIHLDMYESRAGRVTFKPDKRGIATFVCPITDGRRVWGVELTYQDGDGSPGPSFVVASLRRIRKSDGHVETVPGFTISSSGGPPSGPTGYATHGTRDLLAHEMDLENWYYYLQIGMQQVSGTSLGFIGASATIDS
jgi:hypothetical protein